ncbi:MAG: hypothetical protein HGJ94_17205 [Desulfosarcina sp.]|nr:hypothetical protein [Desulfosarcina sp.]MBC2742121.1 hypothetical protein [Desulfosarcina sp.]MBC2765034.1 hypothetical protein [Desulfosarcina sp.]
MKRIILHHDDADGRAAAAIAGRDAEGRGYDNVIYLPASYGKPLPDLSDYNPDCDDDIWVVDFSYPMAEMLQLIEMVGPQGLFWIDHHKTAIEDLAGLAERIGCELPGVRDVGYAGCVLTWAFCNPGEQTPLAIEYIGDRDIWAFRHGDMTRWFYETYINEVDTHPACGYWDRIISMPGTELRIMCLDYGKPLYEARMRGLRFAAKYLGREVIMYVGNNGDTRPVKALKINHIQSGDLGQVIKDMGYDVAWCYVDRRVGKIIQRKNTLYSGADDIDVSLYASARGGGGHKGAAGFIESIGVEEPAS